MARRRNRDSDPEVPLLAALERIYRDADAACASRACPRATECCRFAITGREPYVTSIEVRALECALGAAGLGGRAARGRDGPLPRRRRARSLRPDERTCPLLAAGGRCAVYAWRPLGCRTFWCHRAEGDTPLRQPALNALVRRVQELAAEHRPEGDRGRPLTRALG